MLGKPRQLRLALPIIKSALSWLSGGLWVLLVTFLVVNKFSIVSLNADTSLNTIMSLQRLTLFYWGQNRLLNVIPVVISPIRDPYANVFAYFFISALCFFVAVAALSLVIYRLTAVSKDPMGRLVVLIIGTSLPVIALTQKSLAELALAHPEYPLPIALACAAVGLAWWVKAWWSLPLAAALVFIAIGVNPTIILPLCLALVVRLIMKKHWNSQPTYLGLCAGLSIVAWSVISSQSPWANSSVGYFSLDFDNYQQNVEQAIIGTVGEFSPVRFLVFVIAGALISLLIYLANKEAPKRNVPVQAVVLVFCVIWVLLFAANHWVILNHVEVRYFTFVLFGLYCIVLLRVPGIIDVARRRRWTHRLFGIALVALMALNIGLIWAPLASLRDAPVLQKARQYSSSDISLYAGEYWNVWMVVLDKELTGEPAFGLAARGLSNESGVLNFVRQSKNNGPLKVLCIGGDFSLCQSQIKEFGIEGDVGPVVGDEVIIKVTANGVANTTSKDGQLLALPWASQITKIRMLIVPGIDLEN